MDLKYLSAFIPKKFIINIPKCLKIKTDVNNNLLYSFTVSKQQVNYFHYQVK